MGGNPGFFRHRLYVRVREGPIRETGGAHQRVEGQQGVAQRHRITGMAVVDAGIDVDADPFCLGKEGERQSAGLVAMAIARTCWGREASEYQRRQ